ncbi:hotdog fold thioesterase [Virgibacillus sp. W0181]|uniref:hotdog fold thioesterase n=1 Tax=Virgibacillus sp. W0181 TaxID=3391581 RepID=UPI003F488FD1
MEKINNTLMKALGIEVVALDRDLVEMTMPVDDRTHQPAGYLHGGASVLLAETAASVGAYINVDPELFNVFGMEINANHIKSKKTGLVTAQATPLHIGRTTMVWNISIKDEKDELVCSSRCTIGVVPKK